jgi:hypothetical protein
MGASAPVFTVLVRWWMGLVPDSIAWAQTFALVPLLFAPFVVFIAGRTAGASRAGATAVSCLCALSPMLLVQSARIKQYTWEYALSAVVVGIAAAVRRDGPTLRWSLIGAGVVTFSVAFSFVLVIPSALLYVVFAAAMLPTIRNRDGRPRFRPLVPQLVALTAAAVLAFAWKTAFVPSAPQALLDHWQNEFLGSGDSLDHTARQALLLLRGFWGAFFFRGTTVLLVIPLVGIVWYSWRRWRVAWWLLFAPLVAVAASAAQLYPLGSIVKNRVDAWLIPWIAVLLALTLTEIQRLPAVRRFSQQMPRRVAFAAAAVAGLLLAAAVARSATGYVPTRARLAVAELSQAAQRGEATFVAANDWPVALVFPGPVRFVTDRASETNFSAVLPGPTKSLHADDVARAARELRPACGHTATIVGVAEETLLPVLRQVGCAFTVEHASGTGTGQPHDDVVTVRLDPSG